MDNLYIAKNSVLPDWHQADIICALKKAGWTLRQLSFAHNYSESAASIALKKPWPKMESIIAKAIGIHPMIIWPSRYNKDGKPNRKRGRPISKSLSPKPISAM